MRKGFGLLQVLLVIILVSTILIIAMKYALVSAKQTSDIYSKQGAELFLNSAVEITLLAISGYKRDNTNGCLREVNITSPDNRFIADVNITDYYLLKDSNDSILCKLGSGYRVHDIQTQDSQGMVMLEVVVKTNPNNPRNRGKNIILTRRTLQRP